jgi:hypothetical protein
MTEKCKKTGMGTSRLDEGFRISVRQILRRRIADHRKVKGLEAMKPERSGNGIFGLKCMEKNRPDTNPAFH